jgi:NDP-sugar pyrophosphorylase family protein
MKKPLVVILAGGIGKSFQPLSVNKTIIPFFGKPVLQHMLEMVEQSGFHEALVVTNSENEEWLASYQPFNITIQTKIQDKPLGMSDAILQIEHEIDNRPILVMNAVDFIDPIFFKKLYQSTFNTYAFITGMKVKSHMPAGYLRIVDGLVKEIIEKPAPGQEPSEFINLVFHYISEPQDFIQILKATSSEGDDQYEKALSQLMQQHEVKAIIYEDYWQKLKYAYNVLDVADVFLKYRIKKHRSPSAYVSPNAVIEGDVYIDDNAHIDNFAVIKGPAYIGKYAKIGNHALVRQSIIEAETVVGFGSEVARSYVGPRCMLHHNFIGDSVLESDVNPSWGTTTANLRLDGKTVRMKLPQDIIDTYRHKFGSVIAKGAFLGVNCSIMPGVTIAKDAKVKPGTVVNEAIGNE